MNPSNILIIGTGNRAMSHVIPAAKITFNNIYLNASSPKKTLSYAKKLLLNPIVSLDENSLKNINNIYLAVPESSYIEILNNLKKISYSSNFNIYIEIPFLQTFKGIEVLSFIKKFNNIFACEDFKFSPLMNVFKQKQISKIYFKGTGYHLHTLAQSFLLSKNKKLLFFRKQSDNDFYFIFSDLRVYINNAIIVEDYLGYISIHSDIVSNHYISDLIKNYLDKNEIKNLQLNKFGPPSCNTKIQFLDEMQLIRVVSLYNMFTTDNSVKRNLLNLDQAIYESLVIKISNKFGFFFDIFLFKYSLIKIIILLYYNYKKIFNFK